MAFAATVVVNRTVKAIIHFFIIVYFKCYYSLLFFHIAKKQQKKESYKGFSLLREGISLFIILCRLQYVHDGVAMEEWFYDDEAWVG